MGFVMMLLVAGLELMIAAGKLFCSAVWTTFKVISRFLLLILKPVYRFIFKAIPITTVILSLAFGILAFSLIWDIVSDSIETSSSNAVDTMEEPPDNETDGIMNGFVNRAIARIDKLTSIFDELLSHLSSPNGVVGLVLVIILIAILPIFFCVILFAFTGAVLLELIPLSLLSDIVRNIYISRKQQLSVKELFIEWINYAKSNKISEVEQL